MELDDKEFLKWIHQRLRLVYKDSDLLGHMWRLRAIIACTKPGKVSINPNAGDYSYDQWK